MQLRKRGIDKKGSDMPKSRASSCNFALVKMLGCR